MRSRSSARRRASAKSATVAGGPAISLRDRNVVLVDDGLATGATMIAAARSVRSERAARLMIAVPVGAPESVAGLSREAHEVVCLYQPPLFGSVGRFYEDFSEVTDEDVEEILSRSPAGAQR